MAGFTRRQKAPPRQVVPIHRFEGDDIALVAALKTEQPGAMEALYDRYAPYIQRVLARVVGIDAALPSLLQDVFVEAFSSVGSIKDGSRLRSWLTSIAVFTARGRIRKRSRRLSLWFSDSSSVPEVATAGIEPETREALRYADEILNKLPANERIAFVLRFMEGMELTEVADASRVSLATIKRRLSRAKKKFFASAYEHPTLREWIETGEKRRVK
jgi:RNA polymerase sigma-70 factor (ECF subfamily)